MTISIYRYLSQPSATVAKQDFGGLGQLQVLGAVDVQVCQASARSLDR